MMPDRIGTIGNTQGVNASPSPAAKNPPSISSRLPRTSAAEPVLVGRAGAGDMPQRRPARADRGRGTGGQRDTHVLRDGRVAQPRLCAALVSHPQRQLQSAAVGARDRHGRRELVVIDLLLAEVLVRFHLAGGELRGAELHVAACRLHLDTARDRGSSRRRSATRGAPDRCLRLRPRGGRPCRPAGSHRHPGVPRRAPHRCQWIFHRRRRLAERRRAGPRPASGPRRRCPAAGAMHSV